VPGDYSVCLSCGAFLRFGSRLRLSRLTKQQLEDMPADMLLELDATLASSDIELCFAEMKGPVKDKLKLFGLYHPFGERAFFPTIEVAVSSYVGAHKVS